MAIIKQTDFNFNSPVKGIDPVSKGSFIIEWAYILWEYGDDEDELTQTRAQGEILISNKDNNPLYKIAKESPLRLQGLVACVDFGTEKRFIKIETISNYSIEEDGLFENIYLSPVTFEILDNLEYLEDLTEYKNWNLL